MTDVLIMVFTRNPELGKVKTRLAKSIGDTSALRIYNFLLQHTEGVLQKIDCDKAIYYSENIKHNDLWDDHRYQKHLQSGNNLGERMSNAFKTNFEANYSKVIIVGSDLYDLDKKHITKAIEKLDQNDIVIGPAADGGYYLLGMTRFHETIFKNKKWGTASVFQDTINDLQNESVFLLSELNDIDIYDDIKDNQILIELIDQHD